MQHIRGISRNQMTIDSLESSISANNPIRFIDAFVEHIDLKALGFEVQTLKTEGRPSFDTKIFLKLYLYGYLNGLRSSRKLEKQCLRNLKLQFSFVDEQSVHGYSKSAYQFQKKQIKTNWKTTPKKKRILNPLNIPQLNLR